MAADYKQMEQNFREFYDFSGKTVVGVGAGGGPFTDLVCESKKLIVIDKDPTAIRQWEARVAAPRPKDGPQRSSGYCSGGLLCNFAARRCRVLRVLPARNGRSQSDPATRFDAGPRSARLRSLARFRMGFPGSRGR